MIRLQEGVPAVALDKEDDARVAAAAELVKADLLRLSDYDKLVAGRVDRTSRRGSHPRHPTGTVPVPGLKGIDDVVTLRRIFKGSQYAER